MLVEISCRLRMLVLSGHEFRPSVTRPNCSSVSAIWKQPAPPYSDLSPATPVRTRISPSMCGRYKRKSDKQAISTAFHVGNNLSDLQLLPDDDIRPTTTQPMIRINKESGDRDLVMARWGFVPSWHKPEEKFPGTTFNARAEGIARAGMWKRAFANHRCLVPADSFYEWQKIGPGTTQNKRGRIHLASWFRLVSIWL
jgi:hypothetical protein